jgi:hypothetical protein
MIFIITKTSEFEREAAAAQEAGALFKLTAQQINDINKEFADTYQKGGIENLKKRFQIEAEFTNRYASILSKRFALEDQYADRLNRGLDIEKTRTEFSNKLKDPTDGGDLTGKQAEVLDQRRLANLLKDTGLSGSSSIKDIEDKLFQSEERLREFSTDTDRNGNVRNIPARDRQLGSQLEKRQQEQLQNALELLSSGGEKGAAAMRAFEKASERAQKASEAFLNTFLGSDEDLLNSGRAAALFDAVVKASETGGTGKAKEVLRTADPRARQALNALSGQDDDIKKGLKSALGVSGIVPSTSPEATGVEKILAQQAEAQAALSATTERQITSLDNLSKMLQGDENNAVQQMMNNINQAAVVVNEAAKNMANIPQRNYTSA